MKKKKFLDKGIEPEIIFSAFYRNGKYNLKWISLCHAIAK